MYWNGHGMGAWGWFAMSLTALVVWGLVVGAAVLLVRAFQREGASRRAAPAPPAGPTAPAAGAETLLAQRYARGEIDDEEYARRLSVLRGRAAGSGPT